MKQIAILLLLLIMGGCAATKSSVQHESMDLALTSWRLEVLNGRDVAVVADSEAYTLIFRADMALGGRGSCNLLMGNYAIGKGGSLELSPLGLTRSMCPDMATESEYVAMLDSVTGFKIADDILTLIAGESEVARFKLR
ncbi:MAG: META domain-containing protein [Rikenellaceae bacterium]